MFACFTGAGNIAAQQQADSVLIAQRVDWIRSTAKQISSIDPSTAEDSDLQFLKSSTGNARVVMLGEQSHGEGSIFLAKTRLIKFLHEQMGFNVLAFEGSFPGCARAWEQIRSGANPNEAVRRALYPLWSETEQLQPLFAYLGEQAQGEHPLIFSGFDVRLSGRDDRLLMSELEATLKAGGSSLIGQPEWSWFRTTLDSLGRKERQLNLTDADYARLASYLVRIESEVSREVRESGQAILWPQTVRSISGLIDFLRVPLADWKRGNSIRDVKMAENLLWLMHSRCPGEKFILWGASYHFCRNLASDTLGYDSVRTMADSLWLALGDGMYSIAFSGFEGRVSQWDGSVKPLERAFEGSVEGLLEKTGYPIAFLDLRMLPPGGRWLQEPQYARPLGNNWKHYVWPKHFDGLFFIRNIDPSIRIKK